MRRSMVKPFGFKLVRDVARGDRAEQMLVLANLALEHKLNLGELGSQLLGPGLLLGGLANRRCLHLLDDCLVCESRFDRELLRQQVVAPVAVSDLNHIAAMSELVYVFLQNDFHCISPISSLAAGAASLAYPIVPPQRKS